MSPLQRSTQRSFAPSQKSRRNNRSYVSTEALPDVIFVRAQKLSDISPKVMESGFRNLENFCLRNPEYPGFWNPEYSSSNLESHNRLESRIQVPLTETGIQLPGIWNPQREIHNPRLPWITFHGAGHSVNINLVNQHGRHSVT